MSFIMSGLNHLSFLPRILMGPSPAKQGSEKSPGSVDGVYYGVFLPPDVPPSIEDNESTVVFTDKSEALKLVKKYKKARFKAFRTMTDAMQFAMLGPESVSSCPTSPADVGEKPSPFRGPKPQDMVRFRKAIEAGDLDYIKKTVWENPRFLVSSGDTPAIMQEGSRYNALHIGAKACDAAMCAYILQTVGSEQFMLHFYGDTTDTQQRCTVLLDLYLNTPDKALNETPLHFAAKFGAAKVVQVLVAYPQCDRAATNKFHQTAKDVICSRVTGADSALKEEISAMLDEQFYVPVLRSPDNSVQPVVGKPFSPCSPLEQQCSDIMSPVMEVQALAGPMPRQTAELFRRRWKTPPRVPLGQRRPPIIDQDKGWEKVGRELAQEWKVAWKEYWPFLDTYIDLNSPEGLQLLEDYLHKRFKSASEGNDPSPSPSNKLTSPSAAPMNGVTPESPMAELCSALRACRLSSGGGKPPSRHPPPPRQPAHHNGDVRHTEDTIPSHVTSPHLYMEKSCQVFAKRIADGFQMGDGDAEFLWAEMKHLNVLVSSCKSDNRFSQLDFHRLHSRLGQAVAVRVDPTDISLVTHSLNSIISRKTEDCYSSEEEEEVGDSPFWRRPRLDRRGRQYLHGTVICLARSILTALETGVQQPQPPLTSEQTCADAWALADSCSCTFPTNRHSRRKLALKKLSFEDEEFYEVGPCKVTEERPGVAPADSSGEESDTSDTSECEFFTPPSSPGVRSDDDQAMESPDEGPDVYISGNTPSKLDMSVMEAIRGSELNKAKFPNICRWRHLVLLHSDQERQSWMSPKHKPTPADSSPLWHRSPSLNSD
uniref:Uncharacterized protein n=1 Tax=Cuerna arida TaxID=1464854 RepID=A0A1B6ER65_9HEMI